MGRYIVLVALLALTACQTTGGSWCDIAKPIRLSHAAIDAMSDAEVNAVLAHNEKLAKLCGVRP